MTPTSIVPSIAVASKAERSMADVLANTERQWYEGVERYQTNEDILEAANNGKLVSVHGDGNFALIGRLRDPKLHSTFPPYLLSNSFLALKAIGSMWRSELQTTDIANADNIRLAVTSLVRSKETQDALVADPTKLAVKDSTHCVGAAFDIDASGYYMQQRRTEGLVSVVHPKRDRIATRIIASIIMERSSMPYIMPEADSAFDERVSQALVNVTNHLHDAGYINRILEFEGTPNQCVHIAPNPNVKVLQTS